MSTPPTLLANLTAGVDELKIEADHHTAAVTPEVLVEEVIEHHHANQLRPEQDEGELIELPTQINVTDADSLTSEVSRLIPILSSVGGSPWSVRVAALKRISELCRSPASNTVENFPHQMSRLKECLVEQLTDRRSLVVKQACETIVYLSAQFTAAYLDPSSSSSSASISSDNLSHARDIWIELTKYFIDFLLPIIPITVQVINSSACLCLNHLAKNIAPLYREGKYDYPILGHLILFGASHKHGIVRDHSFRAISNSIIRLDSKYVQHEQALDEMVEEKIQLAAMNKKRKAAAEANGEEFEFIDDENETKSSSSSSPTPSSTLFSSLETVIGSGVFDSFDKTRAAARIALIQFEKISPSRAQRIIESMSPTQQNSYTRQKDEYLINQAVKASANKNAPSSSSSSSLTNTLSDDELEAELNAPKKSSAPSAVNTSANGKKATTTSSTSSVPSKGKFSGKKKALKKKKNKSSAVGGVDNGDDENDEDEIVVVEKSQPKSIISEAEASERAKEANAAAVLAAANKESHDDDDETENDGDEADTESTPITESKQNRPATSDVDEDDSSHGDGVRDSDAGTNKSAPSLYDRNFTLLAKLLDLERPMLTDKMIDFLLHEGVLDVFLSFIVRVRADEIPIESLAKVKSFHDFGAQYHNIFDSTSESSSEVDQTDAPREEYTNLPLTHRHRPQTDNDDEAHAVRRSYFVMQILCAQRQSNSLLAVLTPKVSQMVLRLMCVFHPKSVGNFYHAMAVLQQLLTTFPGTVLTALCSPSGRSLLSLMFDHLHEAPVIPAITAMLNASVNNKVMGASQPSDIIHHLNQMDILHTKLIPRIINYPTQSRVVSQASADFLLQYIQLLQLASTEKAASSMKRLLDDIGMKGKAIDLLMSGLLDSPSIGRPLWQQTNIGTILHTLVTSSAPTMITITETDVNAQALAQMTGNTAALQKKVPNQLFPLKSLIQRMISAKLGPLCQMLTAGEKLPRDTPGFTPDMDETLTLASSSSSSSNVATLPSSLLAPHPVHFSSYTVASSFSSARLQLLKLIVQLVDNDLQDALRTNGSLKPLFTQIPHHTWLVLIDWFFRYRHNNFYLAQFRTLILGMVKFSLESAKYREELKKSDPTNVALSSPCPSEATLKFLFVEAKLLIRMIAFYAAQLDEPSCAGSYVLELCNHFRFSSELMPHSAFLWTYITSCQQWVQFQSTLKDESRKQSYNLHRKPYVEDPLTEQRRQLERALGFSLGGDGPPQNPDAFKIPIGYTEGIELGSVFAWHMGYTEKTSSVSEKGKKKKKKKGKKKKKSKKGDADSTNTSLDDSTTSTNNSGDDGDSDGDDSGIESDASSSSSHSSASSPAKLKKSNPTIQIHSPTNQTTPPPSTNDLHSSADSSSFTSSPTVDVNMKSLESPTNLLAQLTPSPPISPMLNQQANKNQIV